MPINGSALREARHMRGMTVPKLAQASGISERQITRIEQNKRNDGVREHTLLQLARALKVATAALEGKEELPQPKPTPKKVGVSEMISASARLSLELLARRYEVEPWEVFELAPLMFALLAESSLAWRKAELEKLEAATDQVRQQGKIRHLAFAHAAYRVADAADGERDSIAAADLFGLRLHDDAYQFGYDPYAGSPFAHFLRRFAASLDASVVSIEAIDTSTNGRYPDYSICEAELEKIAAGGRWGTTVLRFGHARIGDIPTELWEPGRESERAAYLDSKMPPSLAEAFDNLFSGPIK